MQIFNEKLAKEEIRVFLIAKAKLGKPTTYSELCDTLAKPEHLNPNSSLLHKILGDISSEEHANNRGMLSVFVMSKESSLPGQGFFDLAKNLGEAVPDDEEFFINEFNKVTRYWSTH